MKFKQFLLSRRFLSSKSCRDSDLLACSHIIPSQSAMEKLGAQVGIGRKPGDVIFLNGNLGCGKTCFARGFIRQLAQNSTLQVTSPTYLLVNTYDKYELDTTIYHIDLYRLDTVSDVDCEALGLVKAFQSGITLVEWPERLLSSVLPKERLEVNIEYDENDSDTRHVRFSKHGKRWNV